MASESTTGGDEHDDSQESAPEESAAPETSETPDESETPDGSDAPESGGVVFEDTPFSQLLDQAKEQNDFNIVWEPFVNTAFHVPVEARSGPDDTSPVKPLVRSRPDFLEGEPTLLISEHIPLLAGKGQTEIATIEMYGVQIAEILPPTINLIILGPKGAFVVPKEKVQWIRESIERPD